jgi:hypothetical protein
MGNAYVLIFTAILAFVFIALCQEFLSLAARKRKRLRLGPPGIPPLGNTDIPTLNANIKFKEMGGYIWRDMQLTSWPDQHCSTEQRLRYKRFDGFGYNMKDQVDFRVAMFTPQDRVYMSPVRSFIMAIRY